MHQKSGLLKALRMARIHPEKGRLFPARVSIDIVDWLNERLGWADGPPSNIKERFPLSGSTPHFDRGFLQADLPIVNNWFHYRVGVDVSGTRELAKTVNPAILEDQPVKQEMHLPVPDMVDSVKLYRFLLKNFINIDDDTRKELSA
jgi:oligoribonuclease (3'-5' exoribonuclease)